MNVFCVAGRRLRCSRSSKLGSETGALELVVEERRAGLGKVVVRSPGVRWRVSTYYFVRIWGR